MLLEIDQLTHPSYEGSDVPCLFPQKVHQPQVPGLRCHHSTTEPNDSYGSLPDMAFKCLTLMIEEGITDAYCIMSLLSHIVPYVWQVTARWSTGKSCQRVQFEELESHDQKALWHENWSFTDLTSVQNRSMCSAVKYSQGQLLRGCLRLDEALEREEEKELAVKWCAWWAELQWWIRRDTAHV